MATIVAIEADGGAVLAGDRRHTAGNTVASDDKRHVFDFGDVGAAAVGESGGIDEFRRRLEAEVQSHETEHGDPMSVTRLATVASDIADDEGVEAVVAARDDDGAARVRGVRSDGSILGDDVAAFGSGAQLALGVLEGREEGASLDDAEELARDAVEAAADRDTDTGSEIDTYRLEGGSASP
ncbi:20S proteasome subunit A/B (plasmid) [Halorussus limi]|uniref:proteasome endopeptidase complex n=1 Tax=Halorussus limi TaxID=2938695 RepID=A0A8U0HZK1_9EURY|nr:20S proteasome subunit A/B [Halorussus limi]UPV76572.1 20S proteasome subunit A/B [Halorussus limi]